MSRKLEVEILGDASSLGRAFNRSSTETQSLGSHFGSLAKTALLAGGAAGIAGLTVGIDKSIHAAIAAQASQARLDQAFKAVGLSAAASKDGIDKAEASSRKLGFTDDATRQSLGSLIIATGNVHKSMTDLAVAQDIARFKGVGLEDATKMLTMAMTGSQRAAKQLGISVSPVTTNVDALKASTVDLTTATGKAELAHAKLQDKMATGQAVIDAVSAKVHGQADAFSGTAAGAMEQFHAQLGHIEESLGTLLLPALTAIANFLSNTILPAFSSVAGNIGNRVQPVFHALWQFFTVNILPILKELKDVFTTAVEKIGAVVQAHMPEIRQVFGNLGAVIKDIASVAIPILKFAFDTVLPAALRVVIPVLKLASDGLKSVFDVAAWVGKHIGAAIGGIIDAFNSIIGVLQSIAHYAEIAFGWISKVVGASPTPVPGVSPYGHGAPPRAAGGPVSAGMSYLVGEHGPEIFSPSAGGTIIPNGRGGGGDTIIHTHVYVDGRELFETVQRHSAKDMLAGGFGLPSAGKLGSR